MSGSSYDDSYFDDDTDFDWSADSADDAFWDEFWHLEGKGETGDTFTITIKNDRTGKLQTIENVQLKAKRRRFHQND